MFNTDTGFRFASAAMAVIVSASFFAYAIVPASPALMA
ncbi:MAG: enoyl-CoA hydratase [Pseudomonadota bacterium]